MNDWPTIRVTAKGRERVDACLAGPCGGYMCDDGQDAILTKRAISNGAITIHLQCMGCGRSRSGSLPRAEFPNWQALPEWSDALVEAHRRKIEETHDLRRAEFQSRRAAEITNYEDRKAEYLEWCRTNPAWHRTTERVMLRANGWCEACLSQRAKTVHHLSYELGKLPPAWHLRAVCSQCHDRLHRSDDEWCVAGMERG